jgi:hypothetical protein
MKGDFTRDTFDPSHEFYRVLLQQGRVQLDADWNEQIAILLHRFEGFAVDVFGAHGGPATDCGFAVFQDEDGAWLSRGRYYVEGVQCENREVVKLEPPRKTESSKEREAYLVYLDVFEQYVAPAQDPVIVEAALGTHDTAARSRVRWTVKYWSLSAKAPADERTAEEHWERELERALPEIAARDRRGLLRARALAPFGYTGPQSQLYRVEIHQGGLCGGERAVTWKWSRENGSVTFAASVADATLELKAGAQAVSAFSVGDWVEIVGRSDLEDSIPKRPLRQVTKVDVSAAKITLDASPGSFDADDYPVVRRWDQQLGVDGGDLAPYGGCLPLIEDHWLSVEQGIDVSFSRASGDAPHLYRGGDYWMIPARTPTAAIEWPARGEDGEALPPRGVTHRYAPLAILLMDKDTFKPAHDFRIRCKPLSMMA